MKIEVFLDDDEKPFEVIEAPNKFRLDSRLINDGNHCLRFRAVDNNNVVSEKKVPFVVQNGPEIALHGIKSGATVSGELSVLANAYSSSIGDEFEPHRIETPAPIPTWAWVLFLIIISWGAGYLSQEIHQHVEPQYYPSLSEVGNKASDKNETGQTLKEKKLSVDTDSPDELTQTDKLGMGEWQKLGDQVYGNNCSACHQSTGSGLPGVFPSLVNNQVVIDDDPTEHIVTILNGLSGKVIEGVEYASPMPAFASMLSDEEIAAVVNHERVSWGNEAELITADDVSSLRADK